MKMTVGFALISENLQIFIFGAMPLGEAMIEVFCNCPKLPGSFVQDD